MTDEIAELTAKGLGRSLPREQRQRFVAGDFQSGRGVAALRPFVEPTQATLAMALGISVRTLQGWEQGRRRPEGPGLALLRIAARHPRIIRENLASVA